MRKSLKPRQEPVTIEATEPLIMRPAGTTYGQNCSTGAHYTRTEARLDEDCGHHHYFRVCVRCGHEVKAFCATCGYRQSQQAADDIKYFKRKGAKLV